MIQLTPKARDHVLAYVSTERRIPVEAIVGTARMRPIARARQHAMWIFRELGYSFPEIGRALNRDHTSCLHGWRRHQAILDGTPFRRRPNVAVLSTETAGLSTGRTCKSGKSADDKRMETARRSRQNRPSWTVVTAHAKEAALRAGVTTSEVLARNTKQRPFKARKDAWKSLLIAGYSPAGIADVWGCGPGSIYRASQELGAA